MQSATPWLVSELVYLARVPARVPEFNHPAASLREQGQEVIQAGQIEVLGGGKLEQDGTELGPQMVGVFQKEGQLGRHVAQPLDVSDIPAGFHCELKIRRSAVSPSLEHLERWAGGRTDC